MNNPRRKLFPGELRQPPGRYIAIAIDYLEPGEERDPDLLEKWRPRGTGFTLAEGESHALDLKLAAR